MKICKYYQLFKKNYGKVEFLISLGIKYNAIKISGELLDYILKIYQKTAKYKEKIEDS